MSTCPSRRAWCGALLVLPLAACGVVPPPTLQAPKLALADLSVRDLTTTELRLAATLRVDNPNGVELPLSDLKVELDLFDRPFGSGEATERRFTVPASGWRELPVEFRIPLTQLPALLREAPRGLSGRLPWRLRGRAGWGSAGFPLSFDRQGELDARAVLRRLLPGGLAG